MPTACVSTVDGLTWDDLIQKSPDSKVHGANMGPTWVLSAPDGPHVGPMNLAISGSLCYPVPSGVNFFVRVCFCLCAVNLPYILLIYICTNSCYALRLFATKDLFVVCTFAWKMHTKTVTFYFFSFTDKSFKQGAVQKSVDLKAELTTPVVVGWLVPKYLNKCKYLKYFLIWCDLFA